MDRGEELIIKVIDLKGSYDQIGLEQGRQLKSKIFTHVNDQDRVSNGKSQFLKVKKLLEKFSPNLLKELRGLAKGLNMSLNAAIEQYSGYDVSFPEMGCTTLVQDSYYVRNYDFSPTLYDARLVFMQPVDGYASVGFSQQIIGRLDGMNEKGLVIGLHFVNSMHSQEGFIATTIVRMILDQCANTEEAIELITKVPHGFCYNYSITDVNGNSVIVEASPQQQMIKYTHPLICTNHFETEELKQKNRVEIQGSIKRKQYLQALLKEKLDPLSAFHHFNSEKSPLFFDDYKNYFGTLHTVLYSPTDLNVIIGVGRNSDPFIFSFKEWLQGSLTLPKMISGTIVQGE
ncbi:C45 family autoproteolytic acyltransferase/hydolase [Thermaerobacillus caldiproteolyticus]|uniref:Putative choloylglycine hydrolase n=1 Tax=Thermaerobacillus caldiproteolyticus TaxID=247480 RepID=A0A7V9Z8C5_9BACL|nr:C45 family peptidase [Anoxybacillus caldiproteolyticus]MBA2875850.1 putative choloylglycine hydrolase [Anoxybacillus caldiproteolyticus]QPA32493.1 linear amide C-N hydrolase [Anoxybacillus caldiproteolyticus]